MKIDGLLKERDGWLEALDESEICRLASSFRHGDQCAIFQPRKHGAFNVCFFVKFGSPLERWVLRAPIPMTVSKALLDEKTEIELATIRYVSATTTIPIPKVHAYGYSDTGSNGLPFIIMDYVEGCSSKDLRDPKYGMNWMLVTSFVDKLEMREAKHVYQQLADVYLQLRQLEFPRIGALGLPSRETPALSCDPEDIRVCNRPLSIDIVSQEVDGLEPSAIFPPKTTLPTAKEFVDGLLRLADNKLEKEHDQELDLRRCAETLYAAHHFKQFVHEEWLDQSANKGPFVLAHGDMDNIMSNLLFGKDYNLVAIIDWDFSRIVPARLLVPPIWLYGSQLAGVLLHQKDYNQRVGRLCAEIQRREEALDLPPLLSSEWVPLETCATPPLSSHLTIPRKSTRCTGTLFSKKWCPSQLRTPTTHGSRDMKKRLPRVSGRFMEASPELQSFSERKTREQMEFFEAEKGYYGDESPRRICPVPPFAYLDEKYY
ncbi:hypothetical protein C8A03DRAFT_39840 [Achaetomium macrosporum]|uniref:Aminoglycoside phosphotransferase domain-containing protein n=1 Tax=Achaetomium macrosporum TaxID=79813 RepID=A0AAN7CIW5_9PEZI|nr:hypothetical protein C8A03DRAFT_39840 [Achaetomium macrosporum]